jgi:micrococcal nuclease
MKKVVLIVSLIGLGLFILISSIAFPISIIGWLIFAFGLYQYIQMKRGKKTLNRPLIIVWTGLILSFAGCVATPTESIDQNSEIASDETKKQEKPEKKDETDKNEDSGTTPVAVAPTEEKTDESADKKDEESKKDTQKQEDSKPKLPTATVTRVVDGDTIEIMFKGKEEDVRLLLIDTPETKHPQKPVEAFGPEASQFVKDTLEGKEVGIKVGKEERDKYNRLLAYVFINEETIQEMLLRNGLATTAYLYNDLTMLDEFHKEQDNARNKKIGVWSIPGYAHVDHDHGYHYEEEEEVAATTEPEPEQQTTTNLKYDPNGPDRDCGDFDTQQEAQDFMEASGPDDPHRLDGNDDDGRACESL